MHIVTYKIFFATLLFIFLLMVLTIGFYLVKRRGSPFPKLFFEFDKKMWMTLGLGTTFFGGYLTLVLVLSQLMSTESYRKIFYFFYHHKVESIYIGLFIFAFITISIYFVRMLIKYLYGNRRKD